MIPELYVDESDGSVWQLLAGGVWLDIRTGSAFGFIDRQLTRLVPDRRA